MKKQLVMILMLGIVGLGISSCEDPLNNDMLPEAVSGEVSAETIMDVMSMRFRAQGLAEGFRFDESGFEINDHLRGRKKRGAANLGKRGFGNFGANGGDEKLDESDSTRNRRDFNRCAEITKVENEDGSLTITIDYGTEGCMEYRALIAGKITITKSRNEGNFSYEMVFDNYSETYESDSSDRLDLKSFTLNGFYKSNGAFEVIEGEEDDEENCRHGNFTETHESEFTITFADGSWKAFSSNGEIRETQDSFEVISANFEGSNSDGDTFSGAVIETLVLDYTCERDVFIFTAGIESWTVNGNNVIIDFGDGACDNIVSITKNGETFDINLDRKWFGDDEDKG